jgi:hypothetical protein
MQLGDMYELQFTPKNSSRNSSQSVGGSKPLRPFVSLRRSEQEDLSARILSSTEFSSSRVEYNRQIGALVQKEIDQLNLISYGVQSTYTNCEEARRQLSLFSVEDQPKYADCDDDGSDYTDEFSSASD